MGKLQILLKSPAIWVFVGVGAVLAADALLTWRFWDDLSAESTTSTAIRNSIIGGAAVVALLLAVWRSIVGERQAQTAQRSLQNEQYQKGAEMLGSRYRSVRLAGIYALERLAKEHPKEYHIQIMQVFCAFVRHPPNTETVHPTNQKLRDDIQATMEIIGARSQMRIAIERTAIYRLDLREANLSGLVLRDADLSGALLYGAQLQGAYLWSINTVTNLSDANLSGADLTSAVLQKANLTSADLSAAKLVQTFLTEATLRNARLFTADLTWAHLTNANLDSAKFSGTVISGAFFSYSGEDAAIGLTQGQLADTIAHEYLFPRLEGVLDAKTGKQLVSNGQTLPAAQFPPPVP